MAPVSWIYSTPHTKVPDEQLKTELELNLFTNANFNSSTVTITLAVSYEKFQNPSIPANSNSIHGLVKRKGTLQNSKQDRVPSGL